MSEPELGNAFWKAFLRRILGGNATGQPAGLPGGIPLRVDTAIAPETFAPSGHSIGELDARRGQGEHFTYNNWAEATAGGAKGRIIFNT